MHRTQTTALAIGLAAICAAGLTAQAQETKTTKTTKTTTVAVKGGTNVTVTGCLDKGPNGDYRSYDGASESSGGTVAVLARQQRGPVEARVLTGRRSGQGRRGRQRQDHGRIQNQPRLITARIRNPGQRRARTGSSLRHPVSGVSSMKTIASSCT